MLPPEPKNLAPNGATPEAAPRAPLGIEAPPGLPVAAPPAALSAPPSLGTLMQAFRRCWRLALLCALVGAVAAAGVAWLVVPGQYVGQAIFRIPPHPEGTHILDHQKSHAAFIKSEAIIGKLLSEPGVVEVCAHRYSVAKLDKAMVVDFNQGAYLMRVNLALD